jgi:hypothetical protein
MSVGPGNLWKSCGKALDFIPRGRVCEVQEIAVGWNA